MPQNTSTRATQHCHVTFAAGTTGTTVVATYNTGSCFKLYGGVLTVGQYTWYELTDGSKVSQSLHSLRQATMKQRTCKSTSVHKTEQKKNNEKERRKKKKDRYCCVIKRIKVFQKGTSLLWKKSWDKDDVRGIYFSLSLSRSLTGASGVVLLVFVLADSNVSFIGCCWYNIISCIKLHQFG